MARIARVVLPGIPHHITQRGNRRQQTFFNEDDYAAYVSLLSEACKACDTQVWAWCLMPNHVHLVMVPRHEDGLRSAIAEAHRRYTRRINFREGCCGHLWQERFHSFALDDSHLLAVVRYVERNPVKAGLVRRAQDWAWSSARFHALGINDGLTRKGPFSNWVENWPKFLAASDPEQDEEIGLHTRTGRPLGSESFMRRAERVAGRSLRPGKPGPKPTLTKDSRQGDLDIE